MKISWKYHKNIVKISWKYLENIVKISWKYRENVVKMSWKWCENIVKTRPCTTVRDSEEILGGYSLQKYLSVWFMGISFLISLNNPLFKNIPHVGSFCYLVIWCICVFVFLYLHVWCMQVSFLISLNNPLFKNIQYVGAFWYFVICCICVFVYLYFCIFVFDSWKCHFRYPWTTLF